MSNGYGISDLKNENENILVLYRSTPKNPCSKTSEPKDESNWVFNPLNLWARKVRVAPEVKTVRHKILEVIIMAIYDLFKTPRSLLYLKAKTRAAKVASPLNGR
jgi:hypothetical protein